MANFRKIIIKNKLIILLILIVVGMAIKDVRLANSVVKISFDNFKTMLGVIPPIFVLIGLMDVWIPRETMIKYMGSNSGIVGLLIAFFMGAMAAGPLYAAFPVAGLLIKKGARFAYVVFFLGVWSCAKIPLLLFEMTSLGVKFTIIHVVSMLILFLISALIIEKALTKNEIETIVKKQRLEIK